MPWYCSLSTNLQSAGGVTQTLHDEYFGAQLRVLFCLDGVFAIGYSAPAFVFLPFPFDHFKACRQGGERVVLKAQGEKQ